MAGPLKQRVISDWEKVKSSSIFTPGQLRAAAHDAAEAQQGVWRRRALMGTDRHGSKFRPNSPKWVRKKAQYLSGKRPLPPGMKWTEHKATNPRQVGRFTGRTILDFKWRNPKAVRHGTRIGFTWEPYIATTSRGRGLTSAKLVQYLRDMGIDIWGATTKGSWRTKEVDAINAAIRKRLELRPGESGTMRVIDR